MSSLLRVSACLWLAAAGSAAAADRSAPPTVRPATPIDHPDALVQHPLPGLEVVWVPVPGLTRVSVAIRMAHDATELDRGDTVLTEALGSLWTEAAGSWDAAGLAARTRALDLSVSVSVDAEDTTLWAELPRAAWADALPAIGHVLADPRFPKGALKRHVQDTERFWTVDAADEVRTAGYLATEYAWYPATHPYGQRPDLKALRTLRDRTLRDLHASYQGAGPVTVVVVGDLAPTAALDELVSIVRPFVGASREDPAVGAPPSPPETRWLGVHVADARQASVRVRLAAPPALHPDALAYDAAQWILGGHFLSRLNANLREDKGWTYGVRGAWSPGRDEATWTVRVDVPGERAADAITEIRRELSRLRAEGPTDEELAAFKARRVADWNDRLLTAEDAADAWLGARLLGLDLAEERARLDRLQALDADAVRSVARAWLDGRRGLIVVAGDEATVGPTLRDAGVAVPWVDAEDAVMGRLEDRP